MSDDQEHINTDERSKYDWKSYWCSDSRKLIRREALWMSILFFGSLLMILVTWSGYSFEILKFDCQECSKNIFDMYAYLFLGGLFGGIIFGVKYLYKVVARGRWHEDRRLWRFFSPWLSAGVAIAIGSLFDSGIVGLGFTISSNSGYFAVGFVTGYFADRAIAKMQEVAETMFGPPK